jgi:hypothetical protein
LEQRIPYGYPFTPLLLSAARTGINTFPGNPLMQSRFYSRRLDKNVCKSLFTSIEPVLITTQFNDGVLYRAVLDQLISLRIHDVYSMLASALPKPN